MRNSLSNNFTTFVATKRDDQPSHQVDDKYNWKKLVRQAQNVTIKNKDKLRIATNITALFMEAKKSRSLLLMGNAILKGIIELNGIDRNYYDWYLTPANGWYKLSAADFTYFAEEIKSFPSETLEFSYSVSITIKETQIAGHRVMYNIDTNDNVKDLYARSPAAATDLLKVLSEIKMLKLACNSLSIVTREGKGGTSKEEIVPENLLNYPSPRERDLRESLQAYFAAGLNRSVILYGPPGTGKTTISQTLIANLGIRSLKLRCNQNKSLSNRSILNVIKLFNIDAVILDDFEYQNIPAEMLELLEIINKEVKLTIGIVNNMNDLAPALTRPGRFDEIVEISTLEPSLVKAMVGDLYDEYGEDLVHWPVAYINEFVKRSKILGSIKIHESFQELKRRADDQLKLFGKKVDESNKVRPTNFKVVKPGNTDLASTNNT